MKTENTKEQRQRTEFLNVGDMGSGGGGKKNGRRPNDLLPSKGMVKPPD
jgi:hypothetical protein